MSFKQTMSVRLFGLFKIPMIFYLSPKVIELNSRKTIIKIPLNWRTKNHIGGMYFAAMAAGADIAGGLLAMEAIKSSGANVHLSFKEFGAQFLKRPEDDLYFYNEQGEEVSSFVSKVIDNPGKRMNMELKIVAKCSEISDDIVAEFSLVLSLKLKASIEK